MSDAGVFADGVRQEVTQFIRSSRPIQRTGTLGDVANAAHNVMDDLLEIQLVATRGEMPRVGARE